VFWEGTVAALIVAKRTLLLKGGRFSRQGGGHGVR